MESIRHNYIVRSVYYYLCIDKILGYFETKKRVDDAINRYLSPDEKRDKSLYAGIRKDILRTYWYTLAKPDEYFLYGFPQKDIKERKEFVSDIFLTRTLRMGGAILHMTNENYQTNLLSVQKRVL